MYMLPGRRDTRIVASVARPSSLFSQLPSWEGMRRAISAFCSAAGPSVIALSVASVTTSSASSSPAPTAPSPQPEWAYPSPYDAVVPQGRFPDVSHLRARGSAWDLPALVALWRSSPDETWPWVWCAHNPTGPHHVFVGFGGACTLAAIASASADAGNNVTVVLTPRDDAALARVGVTDATLFGLRCAVVRATVAQVDAPTELLMLSDERIVAYDFATFH